MSLTLRNFATFHALSRHGNGRSLRDVILSHPLLCYVSFFVRKHGKEGGVGIWHQRGARSCSSYNAGQCEGLEAWDSNWQHPRFYHYSHVTNIQISPKSHFATSYQGMAFVFAVFPLYLAKHIGFILHEHCQREWHCRHCPQDSTGSVSVIHHGLCRLFERQDVGENHNLCILCSFACHGHIPASCIPHLHTAIYGHADWRDQPSGSRRVLWHFRVVERRTVYTAHYRICNHFHYRGRTV